MSMPCFIFDVKALSFKELISIIFLLVDLCLALRLIHVKAPHAALNGHSVQLECIYSLDQDSLYAVKWYRGSEEFYRYVPAEEPPATVFPLNGIEVDVSYIS